MCAFSAAKGRVRFTADPFYSKTLPPLSIPSNWHPINAYIAPPRPISSSFFAVAAVTKRLQVAPVVVVRLRPVYVVHLRSLGQLAILQAVHTQRRALQLQQSDLAPSAVVEARSNSHSTDSGSGAASSSRSIVSSAVSACSIPAISTRLALTCLSSANTS